MTHIIEHFNEVQSIAEFRNFLEEAEIHLSIWEGRWITKSGCKGALPIGALVKKISELTLGKGSISVDETADTKHILQMIFRYYSFDQITEECQEEMKRLEVSTRDKWGDLVRKLHMLPEFREPRNAKL